MTRLGNLSLFGITYLSASTMLSRVASPDQNSRCGGEFYFWLRLYDATSTLHLSILPISPFFIASFRHYLHLSLWWVLLWSEDVRTACLGLLGFAKRKEDGKDLFFRRSLDDNVEAVWKQRRKKESTRTSSHRALFIAILELWHSILNSMLVFLFFPYQDIFFCKSFSLFYVRWLREWLNSFFF